MNPFSGVFGIGVAVRNSLYDRELLRSQELAGPVISVGNLSVGGSGKTPFVIALGGWLLRRKIEFDVLSRGYGRRTKGVLRVQPDGTASDFGDEPLLIARRLGVPVWVGERRAEAGRAAEAEYGPRLHLLDDGFQHRALHRDFDIVLVSERDLDGVLLPVGRLREPLRALRRADAIVLDKTCNVPAGFEPLVWRNERCLELPPNAPERPVAFCGIARPQRFFEQLQRSGVRAACEISLRDHQEYDEHTLRRLQRAAREHRADGFITTEKDAVKSVGLENLVVAKLTVEVEETDRRFERMLQTMQERKPSWNMPSIPDRPGR